MKNHFESDELLNQLGKSRKILDAPTLSEEILERATLSETKVRPKISATPKITLALAAALALFTAGFAINLNTAQKSTTQISGSIVMGEVRLTEEQLLAKQEKELSYWGQKAVGNYVSNHPDRYEEKLWTGSEAYWVFVVVDGVYSLDEDPTELLNLLKAANSTQVNSVLSSDPNAEGIRLLIQPQAVGGALYPVVVLQNPESDFYKRVRDILLSSTFTQVPLK